MKPFFLHDQKSYDKKVNILRKKWALKIKWKAFCYYYPKAFINAGQRKFLAGWDFEFSFPDKNYHVDKSK